MGPGGEMAPVGKDAATNVKGGVVEWCVVGLWSPSPSFITHRPVQTTRATFF